jgi:hypothetical protein
MKKMSNPEGPTFYKYSLTSVISSLSLNVMYATGPQARPGSNQTSVVLALNYLTCRDKGKEEI